MASSLVELPDTIQRFAPELWGSVHPLYESGRYAEAADRGASLDAHPTRRTSPTTWPVARASRAGPPTPSGTSAWRSRWDGSRNMAKEDSDFDPIRNEAAFKELVDP